MSALLTINLKSFKGLHRKLKQWAAKGFEVSVDKATKTMTTTYKKQISAGLDGSGASMKLVTEATMNQPIRRDTDPTIRKAVNPSRKPLKARGNAIGSLKRKKISDGYEIAPSTPHGKLVFGYNAAGGKAKVKRDPLIVSDIQSRIIEREIFKSLDKALRG